MGRFCTRKVWRYSRRGVLIDIQTITAIVLIWKVFTVKTLRTLQLAGCTVYFEFMMICYILSNGFRKEIIKMHCDNEKLC